MWLNTLSPAPGSRKPSKRLGRGIGSGHGKTAGKGHKGQKARAGGKVRPGFEGGQTPLYRRLPKFGFKSLTASKHAQVTLRTLETLPQSIAKIDLECLKTYGLIKRFHKQAKIIATGTVSRPFSIQLTEKLLVSNGARRLIQEAGGNFDEV